MDIRAIKQVAIKDARTVAVKTSPLSMPDTDRMLGFTRQDVSHGHKGGNPPGPLSLHLYGSPSDETVFPRFIISSSYHCKSGFIPEFYLGAKKRPAFTIVTLF